MSFLQKYSLWVILAALVVIVWAVISLFLPDQSSRAIQELYSTFYRNQVMQAEQLADALEDGAAVVVLDYERDRGKYKPVIHALKAGGVLIQHVETLVMSDEAGWDSGLAGFPYSEFVRVAEEYPGVDAVIALCGPPYAVTGDPSQLPKLLATDGSSGGAGKRLFDQGWLYAATVPRTVERDGQAVVTYELLHRE